MSPMPVADLHIIVGIHTFARYCTAKPPHLSIVIPEVLLDDGQEAGDLWDLVVLLVVGSLPYRCTNNHMAAPMTVPSIENYAS